jgi:GMP synthase-like glutamine amidotransferase
MEKAIPYKIADLSSEGSCGLDSPLYTSLRPSLDGFDALIIMGGPMGVYEMDAYPFLKKEEVLIKEAIKRKMKILGICLGAQMIAHALGAEVYKGPQREIGWYDVEATEDGLRDEVFSSLVTSRSSLLTVFQWHGDTFNLPRGAVRLASSKIYPTQAFRFSDNVYAFQFHIEVTDKMMTEWLGNEHELKGFDSSKIIDDTRANYKNFLERARVFYRGFFGC